MNSNNVDQSGVCSIDASSPTSVWQQCYIFNYKSSFLSTMNIIFLSIVLLLLFSLVSTIIGIKAPLLSLNENEILYLFSNSAQVLASIYGLTLTGFIFFRNELSREEFEDDTLTDAVESLKNRYFKILTFLTFISIATLFLSNIAISAQSSSNLIFITIIINVGQSFFVINLCVIAYFIFDVISPKRIQKESKLIQRQVDPIDDKEQQGSLETFLKNYNELENIIQKYGQAYQSELEGNLNTSRRRISNVRLAEFILRAEKIDRGLFEEIKSLITLRNTIIHGAEPIVSETMVESSEKILKELADSLDV